MHDLLAEWSERIRAAAAAGEALIIRGGGSKAFYGAAREGTVLDAGGYRGIVDYEPTELVLTARAGTPLAEIEQTLAAQRQMLAFEPPHFGPDATLGGTIACGLSGPRRAAAGSVRDFVLGVRILDGRGDDLGFGGKVMKNVAGYDVSRLMVGAMGTLGMLLDVSLKVLPAPTHEVTLRFELDPERALRRMNEWAAKPYGITATWHEARTLSVRLSGTIEGVTEIARRLGGEPVTGADTFWRDVREQCNGFFSGSEPLWRIAMKPTTPPLPLPGPQAIEWNGALRWARTDADAVLVRDVARKAGGHATCFRGAFDSATVFHPLPPPLMRLHRRLKETFDPAGILNRGRMYPEL
jgi:glycolate oxidase FAD binding subunit